MSGGRGNKLRRQKRHTKDGKKHQKKVSRISVAPYNFVQLPKKVLSVDELEDYEIDLGNDETRKLWQCHDMYIPHLNSGYIDLQITTETPAFVRCGPIAANAGDEDSSTNPHRQDFFHHGTRNHPVIPGSSIRGMVRTLVEITSSAKMSFVEDDHLIYRAVADTTSLGDLYRSKLLYIDQEQGIWVEYPKREMHGGYLEQIGLDWAIRPARIHNDVSLFHVTYDAVDIGKHPSRKPYSKKDVIDVLVKPPRRMDHERSNRFILNMALIDDPQDICKVEDLSNQEKKNLEEEGYKQAVVVRSGHLKNKDMHCGIYEPDDNRHLIPIPDWMWTLYEEDRDMTRGIETRKIKSRKDPLFFVTEKESISGVNPDGLLFFGPTMMFRIPYTKTIYDHIPKSICNPEIIDVPEALFGIVDSKKTIKGRVYFEDAPWDGDGKAFLDGVDDKRTTKSILAGPKPTSFQHYLEQLSKAREKLRHWDSSDANIRGYKLYWHHKNSSDSEILSHDPKMLDNVKTKKDKQRTIIRPVREGTTFVGRIRFENITNFELGALCFVLQLPASKRHKIGMGKPLGMGSVRISTTVSLINRSKRYSVMYTGDTLETGVEEADANEMISEFTSRMLHHYGENVDDLWSVKRMKALSELLEWDKRLDRTKTRYLDLNEWRFRPVLPSATEVRTEKPKNPNSK